MAESTDNMVNQPPHYTFGDIECIDVIRSVLGDAGFVDFCRGTAMAYCWRLLTKEKPAEDAAKAAWYMTMAAHVLNPGAFPDPRAKPKANSNQGDDDGGN